jgi:glycosyltransferase involved in cell wall biosynthesis
VKKISIVVPCFNESKALPIFIDGLNEFIRKSSAYNFEVIFVNDGSKDITLEILYRAHILYDWVVVLNLTRNFGKEAALTAGLEISTGDAIVFMDADLQHPIEIISEFLKNWEQGCMVVAGKRISRETDSKIYKFLAKMFYRIHNKISEVALPDGVGDFRLIDRSVADHLIRLKENRRFMKGLFAWVGYMPTYVEYSVAPRTHGNSSFNKWRSWNFALEGITSFSTVPLRIWSYIGALTLFLGLLYLFVVVIRAFVYGIEAPGYVTLITTVVIFGGIQLIGIGVLGEYVGRIYMEAKGRPSFLIAEVKRREKKSE